MASGRRPPESIEPVDSLMESLRRLQVDADRVLRRRGKSAAHAAGEAPESRKRAGRSRRRAEPLGNLRTTIEQQLTRRLGQVLDRLDVPSRDEIDALEQRLAKVEKALKLLGAGGVNRKR